MPVPAAALVGVLTKVEVGLVDIAMLGDRVEITAETVLAGKAVEAAAAGVVLLWVFAAVLFKVQEAQVAAAERGCLGQAPLALVEVAALVVAAGLAVVAAVAAVPGMPVRLHLPVLAATVATVVYMVAAEALKVVIFVPVSHLMDQWELVGPAQSASSGPVALDHSHLHVPGINFSIST